MDKNKKPGFTVTKVTATTAEWGSMLTPDEIERLEKANQIVNDIFNHAFPIQEKEITFVTQIISSTTFSCPRCGAVKIPAGQTFYKKNQEYHLVQSSISGGGSRFCGPVEKEPQIEEKKP